MIGCCSVRQILSDKCGPLLRPRRQLLAIFLLQLLLLTHFLGGPFGLLPVLAGERVCIEGFFVNSWQI